MKKIWRKKQKSDFDELKGKWYQCQDCGDWEWEGWRVEEIGFECCENPNMIEKETRFLEFRGIIVLTKDDARDDEEILEVIEENLTEGFCAWASLSMEN